MTPFVTNFIIFCMALFGLIILIDYLLNKKVRRLLIELVITILVALILHISTGFPSSIQTFGGFNQLSTIFLMLICVLLGMIGNYFFHFKNRFDWLTFIKPFFISPIVLLPLIGTVNNTEIKTMQLISLLFISFQNGFFWKEVYNKAQKSL